MADIPKIIHLCWFSGDPYPKLIDNCINSWKKILPEYEIMLWDSDRYNAEIDCQFAKEAFYFRKWAFVADYVRLYALYNYGGIYLDSDVEVFKSFDKFLKHDFFAGVEASVNNDVIAIEAGIMGAKPKHPFTKACLEMYDDCTFISETGRLDQVAMPLKIADIAARQWGFKYKKEHQELKDGVVIYDHFTFTNRCGYIDKSRAYAIHLFSGSWKKSKMGILKILTLFFKIQYHKYKSRK